MLCIMSSTPLDASPATEMRRLTGSIKSSLFAIAIPVALMWLLEALDWVLPTNLDRFGIRPRHLDGADGIVFAPFLHAGWSHLISNTIPFVVLGGILAVQNVRRYLAVFAGTALGSGVGTWLVAPSNSVHLGASGVIFGFLGYTLVRGLFDRQLKSILIGVGVGLFYGGLVWGVLPRQSGVSWQAHLFGFLSGIALAALHGKQSRANRSKPKPV